MKILMIAPACYPVNGAEAIVNFKLLTTLLNNGLEVDVVSKNYKGKHYPSDSKNEDLLDVTKIHVVEVDNKVNIKTLSATIMCIPKFGVTFKGAHWAYAALPIVERLVKENHYDYVVTKNAPSFLLGNYLKKKYGLQWVASWNDPYPREKYPKPYGYGWDYTSFPVNQQVRIMRNADIHIFPNVRLKNWMQMYLLVQENKTMIVPHVMVKQPSDRPQYEETLRLIHSGNLTKPRDPEPLIRALYAILSNGPSIKIELSILGVVDERTKILIHELNLEDRIHLLGNTSYQESINLLSKYHVAVIVEANCPEGIFLPTKVADFMGVDIPIMSLSPRVGILNDLYKEHKISYFADISNEDDIRACLLEVYNDFKNKSLKVGEPVVEYTPQQIARQYKSL